MVMIWLWQNRILEQTLGIRDFRIEGHCLLQVHLGSHGEQTVASLLRSLCWPRCLSIVTVMVDHYEVVVSIQLEEISTYFRPRSDWYCVGFHRFLWSFANISGKNSTQKAFFPWLLLVFLATTEICELFLCCCRLPGMLYVFSAISLLVTRKGQ